MQKEVFVNTINEDGSVLEDRYIVFLDADGKEIARSKPYTCTIAPGDPTKHYSLVGDRTRTIIDALHTPEVIAKYKAKMAEQARKVEKS